MHCDITTIYDCGALAGYMFNRQRVSFLERSVKLERCAGIAVVPTGNTTRYLSDEIGTEELENKN